MSNSLCQDQLLSRLFFYWLSGNWHENHRIWGFYMTFSHHVSDKERKKEKQQTNQTFVLLGGEGKKPKTTTQNGFPTLNGTSDHLTEPSRGLDSVASGSRMSNFAKISVWKWLQSPKRFSNLTESNKQSEQAANQPTNQIAMSVERKLSLKKGLAW